MSLVLLGAAFAVQNVQLAFAGVPVPISEHHFIWTDPSSGGKIDVWEQVILGCSDGHAWEYTFVYRVNNIDYAKNFNGLSGWQLIFDEAIPEFHNQMSPAIGGPWVQNAFSGSEPPFGAEWDAPNGAGILPGQSGVFEFCTDERADIVVNDPPANTSQDGPNGWAHTWDGSQILIFNGPNSIPGQLLKKIGGETLPIDSTALLMAGIQSMTIWMVPAVVGLAGAAVFLVKYRANRD